MISRGTFSGVPAEGPEKGRSLLGGRLKGWALTWVRTGSLSGGSLGSPRCICIGQYLLRISEDKGLSLRLKNAEGVGQKKMMVLRIPLEVTQQGPKSSGEYSSY